MGLTGFGIAAARNLVGVRILNKYHQGEPMTKEFNIDLEALSKGITNVEGANDETKILMAKAKWRSIPETAKEIKNQRRALRKALFTVLRMTKFNKLDTLTIEERAIQEIFDKQMKPNLGITWEKFTFTWDVHPVIMTELILKENWFTEGGVFDEIGGHAPTAFTKQEI